MTASQLAVPRLGFTGIEELKPEHHPTVDAHLQLVVPARCVTFTGGAAGVDTYVANWLLDNRPEGFHYLALPWCDGVRFNVDLLDRADEFTHIYKVVASEPVDAYRKRNEVIVLTGAPGMASATSQLIAFPRTSKELFRGSGTWMTIRIARKYNRPVDIFPLEA